MIFSKFPLAVSEQVKPPDRNVMPASADVWVVTTGGGGTGIQWVEARDTLEPPVMYRTGPMTETCPAADARRAEAREAFLHTVSTQKSRQRQGPNLAGKIHEGEHCFRGDHLPPPCRSSSLFLFYFSCCFEKNTAISSSLPAAPSLPPLATLETLVLAGSHSAPAY